MNTNEKKNTEDHTLTVTILLVVGLVLFTVFLASKKSGGRSGATNPAALGVRSANQIHSEWMRATDDYHQTQTRTNYDRMNRLREEWQAAKQAEAREAVMQNSWGR